MLLHGGHYHALGLAQDATTEQVEAAYRRALQRLPVSLPGRALAWLLGCSRADIDRAHQVLSNPLRRVEYDRQIELDLLYGQVPPGH